MDLPKQPVANQSEPPSDSMCGSEQLARGQVEALERIVEALAKESEPSRLIEHVLRTMTAQLGAHSASVWRREDTGELARFEYSFEDGRFVVGSDPEIAGIELTLPIVKFWPWHAVFESGRPGIMDDIRSMPPFPWQERLISLGVITILIVPMSISEHVDAVVGVRFTRRRNFSAEDLDLAQALANQVMLGMQLTRLSAQSQASAVKSERERAADALRASEKLARGQVEVLKKALEALAREPDPDRLVGHVLRIITEQFGAHSSSVWRRDEASGTISLEFAFENGVVVPKTDERFVGRDLRLPMEEFWPWPEVFRTGKPSVIEDIRLVPPFALRDRLVPWGIVTVLLVPLFASGRLEGAIGLRFMQQRSFGAEEVELAQALANQATLVMQLADLHGQNRQIAIVAERNRMARDIHDTLAQGFTGIIVQLEAAKGVARQGDLAQAVNRIERAGELARASLEEARRSVRALRPRLLREGTLFLAITELLRSMSDGTGLGTEFLTEGEERAIPAEFDECLLRITQEALTNTVKHAKAKLFKATLSVMAGRTQLRLADDGIGFDPQAVHDGFGLLGMKERVDRINGELIIRSRPDMGTEIFVVLERQSTAKSEHGN